MTNVATAVVALLAEAGIRHVFGVPSGPWAPYMDAMRTGPAEFVLTSTEAAAGFMAAVCGYLSGRPGACYGTFGPGATNLRQTLRRAVQVATAEVPGPVHIGLPADLGDQAVAPKTSTAPMTLGLAAAPPHPAHLQELARLLRQARRPLLVLGLSCTRAANRDALRQFLERQRVPVVLSPMTKGLLPEDHPAYVGVLFHALSDIVAETIREADLVLALGYDPVEFNYEEWLPDVPLIHADTVPADVDASCQLAAEVVGDLGTTWQFLGALPPLAHTWDLEAIGERRQRMFATLTAPRTSLAPSQVLGAIQDLLQADGPMVVEAVVDPAEYEQLILRPHKRTSA